MVTPTELDTFIQKFHQLWNDGHTAHLDLDTCAGKAWVGLHVQLGHAPGPSINNVLIFQRNPWVLQDKDDASEGLLQWQSCWKADQFTSVEETESEAAQNTIEKERSKDVNNDLEELEAVEVLPESYKVEASDVAEEAIEENDEKEITNSNENENTEVVGAENASTAANVSPVPDIVPVYCAATLENCPDGVLSQDCGVQYSISDSDGEDR